MPSGSPWWASGPRRRPGAPALPPLRRLLRRHALGSWSGITTVLIQTSAKLTQRPRLSAAFRLCFPGKTRGTPLLACPCQDSPGAPHRPVLPGWSPLFAGSPRPIPHRGAPASLATALAQGGKWSLHASPLPLRAPLSGCFQCTGNRKTYGNKPFGRNCEISANYNTYL